MHRNSGRRTSHSILSRGANADSPGPDADNWSVGKRRSASEKLSAAPASESPPYRTVIATDRLYTVEPDTAGGNISSGSFGYV
jgi:hypothetical protein